MPIAFDRRAISIVDSYNKNKIRKESKKLELMTKKNIFHVFSYLIAIRFFTLICLTLNAEKGFRFKYEEFCEDPENCLKRVKQFRQTDSKFNSRVHSVSGNPDRLIGKREIKLDEKFKESQGVLAKTFSNIVDWLTFYR